MRDEVLYEHLIYTQSGVLPQIALINAVLQGDTEGFLKTLKIQDFKIFKDTPFDVENDNHWKKWYQAMIKIALEHDKVIIEYENGVALLTQGRWHHQDVKDLTNKLKPLQLPKHWNVEKRQWQNKAKQARKNGYLFARQNINTRIELIAV